MLVDGESASGPSGRSVEATRIYVKSEHEGKISGSAVIDALPVAQPSTPMGSLLVRADGYRILITGNSRIKWDAPLSSLADVRAGDWIDYEGNMRADGVVVAQNVRLSSNMPSFRENLFRAKTDYDPSTVPATAKQSRLNKAVRGVDYRKIPPYKNQAMQARLDTIGNKLIPVFQRTLPDNAAWKIKFRFQLIDEKSWHDARTLPSGVILVPYQVVERMQNDSQLATILADNISCALERQDYRMQSTERTLAAGQLAADVAGLFVPGAGLLAPATGLSGGAAIRAKEDAQSGRVSLGLLHDAGYDIDQAPIAWLQLASTGSDANSDPNSEIHLPRRAADLYRILGEEWHNPAAAAEVTH